MSCGRPSSASATFLEDRRVGVGDGNGDGDGDEVKSSSAAGLRCTNTVWCTAGSLCLHCSEETSSNPGVGRCFIGESQNPNDPRTVKRRPKIHRPGLFHVQTTSLRLADPLLSSRKSLTPHFVVPVQPWLVNPHLPLSTHLIEASSYLDPLPSFTYTFSYVRNIGSLSRRHCHGTEG